MIKQTQLLQNIVICQWPADPLFADCAPLTATSKKAIRLDHVYTGPDKFLDGKIFYLCNPFTWNCARLQFCLPFKNLRGSADA